MRSVGIANVGGSPFWSRNFCGLCDSFHLGSFLERFRRIYTMVGSTVNQKNILRNLNQFVFTGTL